MSEAMRMKYEGKLDQLKGRLKDAWADLTDDDLMQAEGKWERLVGVIKEKTGETADVIQTKLHDLLDRSPADRR